MLNDETKRKINSLRDILVGKVPNPASQVEQITNALIYKYMDDMDRQAEKLGGKPSFFVGEYEQYSWRKLMDPKLGGQDRMNLYVEALEKMGTNPNLSPIFRDILKGAFLPYRSPETLNLFLHEIDSFEYKHSEELGNAFELLLSIMGSQADAGMFRTPRHIIDFIVAVIVPKKDEKILDPACGTAGFLVSAFNFIRSMHDGVDNKTGKPTTKESRLTNDEIKQMHKNLVGYDISPEMCKLSRVNLFLHSFPDPKIYEYDTLSSDERWDDTFDVIMANPPFMTPKGGIIPHKRFTISANKAEALFVDYIIEHLKPKGRAGIIVPEGIIFKSERSYKSLRKMLVEDGLYAVISLPAGVFNPYSGVKTSILLFHNELAKKTDEIIFVKVEKDGFNLGATRQPLCNDYGDQPCNCPEHSDLPEAMDILYKWNNGEKADSKMVTYVTKSKIAESGDYNLTGDRYREAIDYSNVKWPMVELGEICEILDKQRKPITKSDREVGEYPYYGATGILDYVKDFIFSEKLVLVGEDGAKWGIGDKTAFIANGKYWVNNHAHVLRPDRTKILDELLVELINNMNLAPYITGVTVPKLNQEKLRSIQIPLPPLELQEQIVAELDGYQKVIDGARQVVENWKPTIKIDPGWEKVKLGEVADIVAGQSPEGKYYNDKGEGMPFYQGKTDFGNIYIGEPKKWTTQNTKLAEDGDILMSVRAPVGPVNIATQKNCIGRGLAGIRAIKIEQMFLFTYLQMIEKDIVGNGGAVFDSISKKQIEEIKVPLPPLKIQRHIVEEINEERKIVEQNKNLIEIFEGKIKEKIDEVWGK